MKIYRAKLYPVPGFDDLLVSKDGHTAIRSKTRICRITGELAITLKNQWTTPQGYRKMYYNKKTYFVHRLMLLAFKPNPENKPFANHLDGVRHNNNIENLEWATQSDNELHKIYVLNKDSQLKKRKVLIIKNGSPFRQAKSVSEAARMISGQQTNISQCCLGHRRTHKGYSFIYLERWRPKSAYHFNRTLPTV